MTPSKTHLFIAMILTISYKQRKYFRLPNVGGIVDANVVGATVLILAFGLAQDGE